MKIKTISQGGIAALAAVSFALTACGEKEGKGSDVDKPKDENKLAATASEPAPAPAPAPEPARVITHEKLEVKNDLAYERGQATPFTGLVQGIDGAGGKYELNYKDGKKDGVWTEWRENGQKQWVYNYKDGKLDGVQTTWYENGQKSSEGNYEDGKQQGEETSWYENGLPIEPLPTIE